MGVEVVDKVTVGHGSGVELEIGGKQCQGRGLGMDFKGGGELHGVVAAKAVGSCLQCGVIDQHGRRFDDEV